MEYYDKSYYIAHYGVKGMHWGERRFQNPDGSLTDAGRIRYDVGKRATEVAGKALEPSIKTKEGKTSPAEKGLKSVQKITDKTRDIAGKASSARLRKKEQSIRRSISDMSNDELQQYITRANLETSYARLKASETSSGVGNVLSNALGLASDVLGVVTPVVSLVVLLRTLGK